MKFFFIAASTIAASSALLAGGCGAKEASDNVTVAVKSTATNAQASSTAEVAADPALLICIKSIKVEQESEGTSTEVSFPIGLVDASRPEVNWGNLTLPKGFSIARIKIKVHKDKDLCNSDYSLQYGNQASPQDIEFRWRFSPPIVATDDLKTVQVSFREVLDHLADAVAAGTISSLKERVEEVEAVTK